MKAMRVMIKSVPLSSFIWVSWNGRNNHFCGGKSNSRWPETRRTRHIYPWFYYQICTKKLECDCYNMLVVTNESYWNKLIVDFVRTSILIRFINTIIAYVVSKWSAVERKNASFPMVLVVWATGARHFNRTCTF